VQLKNYAYAFIYAAVYWLLMASLSNYAREIDLPNWWISAFGFNYASTMVWWEIMHSVVLFVLALPVAFLVVRFSGNNVVPIAMATSVILTFTMAFIISWGWGLLLTDFNFIAGEPLSVLAALYDVFKMPALFLLSVWLIRRLLPSNKSLQPTAEAGD
jgi:hypothetical protein